MKLTHGNNQTGALGEAYIYSVLNNRGMLILHTNYHSRFGEIDMIARDQAYIVFVEVKTRKARGLTNPFESVTRSKQRKIILTAQDYLSKVNSGECDSFGENEILNAGFLREATLLPVKMLQPRFDVAAVFTENQKITGYEYLENAFGFGE